MIEGRINPPEYATCVECGDPFEIVSDNEEVCRGCIADFRADAAADRWDDRQENEDAAEAFYARHDYDVE